MASTAHGHGAGHDPHLAHQFETPAQQFHAVRLGMWLFLATEVLFFGGLFCAYAVYRSNHPEIFYFAHRFLDQRLGAVNTVILICSSFTMAWAVRAAQLRQARLLQVMLSLTLLCAFGFLGVKAVEYRHKWEHGLLWARKYHPTVHQQEVRHAPPPPPRAVATQAPAGAEGTQPPQAASGPAGLAAPAAAASEHNPKYAEEPRNARTFFSIYFLMTGLHGIHVLGGIGAMLWLLVRAARGHFATGYFTPVDMVGLYWHLVDLIWIYLFLLLYLIH
jgi:cytochrome c oxidase subunit III